MYCVVKPSCINIAVNSRSCVSVCKLEKSICSAKISFLASSQKHLLQLKTSNSCIRAQLERAQRRFTQRFFLS